MADQVSTKKHLIITVASFEGMTQVRESFRNVKREFDQLTFHIKENGKTTTQEYNKALRLTGSKEIIRESLLPVKQGIKDIGEESKKSTGKSNDFINALKRAVIVAPIWMAARNAMMAFMSAMKDGVQYINDMDKAMARAQAVMHGTSGNIRQVRDDVQQMARSLSMETGKPIQEVIEIFYRLGTAGIDAKTALGAMPAILKTSISMMGDTTETARVLAQTYNLLGKSMDKSLTESEKFTVLGGTLAGLWQMNQMELNEFLQALEKSGSTMAQYNIDAGTTMALLATFHQQGLRGAQAGTILSRVFDQLVKNTDKLGTSLGINLEKNKAVDWAQVLYKTIDRLNNSTKSTPAELKKILEVFDIRAAKGERALLLDPSKLKDNLDIAKRSYEEMQGKLKELSDLQLQTTDAQINRFKILRNEAVLAFLQGSTGIQTFSGMMIELNKYMLTNFIPGISLMGITIRKALEGGFNPVYSLRTIDEIMKEWDVALGKIGQAPNIDKNLEVRIATLKQEIADLSDPSKTQGIMTVTEGLAEKAKIYYEHLEKIASNLKYDKSELLDTKALMESITGITKDEFSILKEKLEKEREITYEKKKQKDISEETKKLYQISKRYGSDVANQVAQMVSGELSPLDTWTREGKLVDARAVRAFTKMYPEQAKNKEISTYFSTGAGRGVMTSEKLREKQLADEILRTNRILKDEWRKTQKQPKFEFASGNPTPITTGEAGRSVVVIEGNVFLDGKNVGKWMGNQLDASTSEISKAVDKKINNF